MQQVFRNAKASKIFFSAVVASAALAGSAHAIPVSGQGTWETTLHSRDINSDGVVDAYYDSVLNISWLADANLPKTLGIDEGIGAGNLYADSARAFVDNLDVHGVTGWRLSNSGMETPDGCRISGGIRCGFQPSTSDSELAHLYYATLGNSYGSITNTGNFLNLGSGAYLMDPMYQGPARPNGSAFQAFNFGNGQKAFYLEEYGYRAFAVHDGDIMASPAPEPETWAMMLAGLAGLGAWARRQKKRA